MLGSRGRQRKLLGMIDLNQVAVGLVLHLDGRTALRLGVRLPALGPAT